MRVMRGLELLRAHGIPISVLSVLSSKNIGHPDEMFFFFVDNGFYRVAFNVEEIEGPNLNSSLLGDGAGLVGARARYSAFMGRLARLNKTHGWPLKIRELASVAKLMQKRRADPNHVPLIREQRAGSIVTMTRDGSIYSWSPELASGDSGLQAGSCLETFATSKRLTSFSCRSEHRRYSERSTAASRCAASNVTISASAAVDHLGISSTSRERSQ